MPRFWRDARGASAVEFAILAGPFIFLILCILQVGIYYMTQSSLDGAVIKTADAIRNNFSQAATPTMPSASSLKSTIVSNAGGLIYNDASLAVEIRQLTNLAVTAVPISGGTADYGTTTSTLVLRAQAQIVTFVPGFSSLALVTSSALVRRQGR